MTMRRYTQAALTDAGGAADTTTGVIAGRLHEIRYDKNATIPYDNGVDFTITNETTGEVLWQETNVNASTFRKPREATHTNVGAAATYDGTRPVLDYPVLARDRIRIVIAQGGNAKLGSFKFCVDG